MSEKKHFGLTGSFGSGCTSLRKVLETSFKCGGVGLSDKVKEEAKKRGLDPENRKDLQNVGDALRKEKGGAYLAEIAIEKSKSLPNDIIIFDGIRNTSEIKTFRKFPEFYLISAKLKKMTSLRPQSLCGEISILDKYDG